MAERKTGAPTNAAKLRVPFVPLGAHVAYVEWQTNRLAKRINPDTTKKDVQDRAIGKLKIRRVVEKVEQYGGAAVAVAGGAAILLAGAALAPEIAVGAGIVLAVDATRRRIRDKRFGVNKKVSELTTLQQADTIPAVEAASRAVSVAEARSRRAQLSMETGMVEVLKGRVTQAPAIEAPVAPTVEPMSAEPVAPLTEAQVAIAAADAGIATLDALVTERDAASSALVQARDHARRVSEAAGGVSAERQFIADHFYLEKKGRRKVKRRAARLARLAQRTWEDSKNYMNISGAIQQRAEGLKEESKAAHQVARDGKAASRSAVRGDSATAVIIEANDNE